MLRLEKKLKAQIILAMNNIPIQIHPTRKEYATLLKLYPPVLAINAKYIEYFILN